MPPRLILVSYLSVMKHQMFDNHFTANDLLYQAILIIFILTNIRISEVPERSSNFRANENSPKVCFLRAAVNRQ